MSASVPPGPSLHDLWSLVDASFGAGICSSWIAIFLCGLCVAQAYHYFHAYAEDSSWTKMIAWVVTLLNILHIIFVCEACYYYLITTARQDNIIDKAHLFWALPASVAAHVAVAGAVFCYFILVCHRLLSRKVVLVRTAVTVALVTTAGSHIGTGIATVVKVIQTSSLFEVTSFRQSRMIPMLSTQLAADVVVSLTLCLALPKPTHEGTRHVTRSIIVYTASRGIVTAVAALVELLMLLLAPRSLWFVAIEYIIPSLYANSFFSALNSRKRIRGQLMQGSNATPPMALPLRLIRNKKDANIDDTTGDDASTTPRKGVKVEVFTIQKHDDEVYEGPNHSV